MLILNISPLKEYREFRLLFFGQLISFMGSMITYVAVPYQVYELTKNSFLVGLLGVVQLVPVLLFGMLGGSFADRLNRRKLLLVSEILMCTGTLGFVLNASLSQPSVIAIFVLAAFLQSVNSFHRPSMEAMTQKLVSSKDYAAVGALSSFRFSFCAVAGPAIGGVLIASYGLKTAYLVDLITYMAALLSIWLMKAVETPTEGNKDAPIKSILEGIKFAKNKPEIMGTYIVDIVAMTFAFPTALFPAMAENWGGAKAAGILFSSMSVGSLFITLFSGWTSKVNRHGAAVVISACLWGAAIVGLGLSTNLYMAAFFLALSGALDSISAMFRSIIWNQTIPNNMRGRLAGLEMISYMSGPLAGNMRSGWAASLWGVPAAVVSGGALCVAGVIASGFSLPRFWNYRGERT